MKPGLRHYLIRKNRIPHSIMEGEENFFSYRCFAISFYPAFYRPCLFSFSAVVNSVFLLFLLHIFRIHNGEFSKSVLSFPK